MLQDTRRRWFPAKADPTVETNAMTPLQCRAARALLDWTQLDLALSSGVSVDTIQNFESGLATPRPASIQGIIIAFESAGVTFIGEGDERFGATMRNSDWRSQFRAARSLLHWAHAQVAAASGVSDATVRRFELGQAAPRRSSFNAIRRAFEGAGIVFVENDGELSGVMLQKAK